jgi:hypothetical protein
MDVMSVCVSATQTSPSAFVTLICAAEVAGQFLVLAVLTSDYVSCI